jgi:hypothetical protein
LKDRTIHFDDQEVARRILVELGYRRNLKDDLPVKPART